MIEKEILDNILPVEELETLKNETINELEAEGFVVTNWREGGVFNTLLSIFLQILREMKILCRTVLNNMYLRHASGEWLDLKAADFSKVRKQASKTKGLITITRTDTTEALRIPRATVFKTKNISGEELKYFTTKAVIMPVGAIETTIEIEAEKEGSLYNLPSGQITKCLIHLTGVESISNLDGWIVEEGQDTETDKSLANRSLNAWAELSVRPIADKYKNACAAVDGVLYVQVNDRHPRGQGTIDIIVTSTAGTATEALLERVREAVDTIIGTYEDVLVKSSITVIQDINIIITMQENISTLGVEEKINNALINMLKIGMPRKLNELNLVDIIVTAKETVPTIKNIKVLKPIEDITLEADKVIIAGNINITIEGG